MSDDKPLTFMGIPIYVSQYLPEGVQAFAISVDHGDGPSTSAFSVSMLGNDGQISFAHHVEQPPAMTLAGLVEMIERFRNPPLPRPPMAIMSPRGFVSITVNLHLLRTLSRRARRAAGDMRHRYAFAVASAPVEYRALAQAEIDKVKARASTRERRRGRVVRRAKHGWRT